MTRRPLGKTGLNVSELGLGSVSLGLAYGIPVPGDYGQPAAEEATAVIRRALDAGINFIDTAPGYGDSERLLGNALPKDPDLVIATKVHIPMTEQGEPKSRLEVEREVNSSVERSLKALKRDVLDIVKIHNAVSSVLESDHVRETLSHLKSRGTVRHIGASIYTEAEAEAALRSGVYSVLQVPYSLLDQRMAAAIFQQAADAGVGIVVRSALLKGILTEKSRSLPPEMTALKEAAERVCTTLNVPWESLPETAIRFCLSHAQIATVLVGARKPSELDEALAAAAAGGLEPDAWTAAQSLSLREERLYNPIHWPIP